MSRFVSRKLQSQDVSLVSCHFYIKFLDENECDSTVRVWGSYFDGYHCYGAAFVYYILAINELGFTFL